MMKITKTVFLLVCMLLPNLLHAWHNKENAIRKAIMQIVKNKQATIGVAFSTGRHTFTFNDGHQYPLMSVFKYPVAFTALKKMEREHTGLNDKLHITSAQMHKNTYSPLRERYPDQDFTLSYGDLLRFCISESDNNACDILIDYVGGIREVAAQVARLGITDMKLTETEATMHASLSHCYHNWSTPSAMVELLEKIYEGNLLSPPYDHFLKQIMLETTTGTDKIKAGLPANVPIGHKTGSSDRLSDGRKIGDNDAGVIYLPQGRKCFIAIFIKDSKETDRENASLMARIGKAIYDAIK